MRDLVIDRLSGLSLRSRSYRLCYGMPMTDQIDYQETVTVHLLGEPFDGGEVWRGPLFQAVRMVMAMPPDQQQLASVYFYDGGGEIEITFTDIKEIAERADFPSSGMSSG